MTLLPLLLLLMRLLLLVLMIMALLLVVVLPLVLLLLLQALLKSKGRCHCSRKGWSLPERRTLGFETALANAPFRIPNAPPQKTNAVSCLGTAAHMGAGLR